MKNILISIKMLAVVLVLASCSDNYLDINTDPNKPLEVSPNLLLPVAQNYSAFSQERNRGNNTLGNMFMYNWSQSDGFSWYTEEFLYLVTPSFYQQNFDYVYANALKQYNSLSTLEGAENGNYQAIGNIMKAYHYNILVDTYGDIPYSEALLRGSNPTPAYDDAQVVYEDLIVQLSAAIALIDETSTNINALLPGADDGIFEGDMDMWKKFANSIKLRMLVRQSDMSGRAGYIQTELAAIAAEGSGYITSDVEVNIGYNNGENQQNPKWAAFGKDVAGTVTNNNQATCATDYILTYLTNTNDPRLDRLYEKPATGHLGVMQGLQNYDETEYGVDGLVPAKVSNIGPGILKSASQGAVLYTAAEAYFNQAEIDLKFNAGANAQALYESGIQASFTYLGLTAAKATTYYNQAKNLVYWNNSPNKLQAIITQKWIAVNGIDAIQSWFDYNRTGYPANLPISALATAANRPVRLAYPASEVTSNTLNLPAQPNVFTAKIFWAN